MEDKIAGMCYKKYMELGKNGKPNDTEWTLLAGFVVKPNNNDLHLVSLATGTKCIGKSKMSSTGSILNDSHAEVLARRGLLRYIYKNIEMTLSGDNTSLFIATSEGKYRLKSGIEFHFFCSHVPCGDASIIPMLKRKSDTVDTNNINVKKLKTDSSEDSILTESKQTEEDGIVYEDVYRTGGKCVNKEDSRDSGISYHTLAAVRTKPGRGDPTLSLSCSDKIAKWVFCGLQGALLSLLIDDRIDLKSITVGGGGQFCMKAMERALINRCKSKHFPVIKQSSLVFTHSRYLFGRDNPCATSIIWADVKTKPFEVSVEGRLHGVTKKSSEPLSRLKISKIELFIIFMKISGEKFKGMTYSEVKSKAEKYYQEFDTFKKNIGSWSTKPPLLEFTAG